MRSWAFDAAVRLDRRICWGDRVQFRTGRSSDAVNSTVYACVLTMAKVLCLELLHWESLRFLANRATYN